jgi:hypothetical protein
MALVERDSFVPGGEPGYEACSNAIHRDLRGCNDVHCLDDLFEQLVVGGLIAPARELHAYGNDCDYCQKHRKSDGQR